MKNVKLFSMALAALMLGACSSDEVAVNDNQTVTGGEKGYVNLSINLPTQPTSRANDKYDDGLPAEYKVNDATLLLFAGTTEAAATFQSAYELDVTGFATQAPADDNITTKATLVQEITTPTTTTGQNIYALVVINDNDLLTVNANVASLNGTSLTGKTFAEVYGQALTLSSAADLTGDGFFMTNAPLANKAGGPDQPTGVEVTTLAKIDKTAIYHTVSEASSKPATTIYVERAVAKVTVNATDAATVTGGNPLITAYDVEGWAFNVLNTKTYAVRNVAGANWWEYTKAGTTADYRFVGSTPVATGLYRTYWGIDPNYSTAYAAGDFTITSGTELDNTTLYGFGENNPGYCIENTFNTTNQINNRTTQVVLKAKLSITGAEGDGTFYTLNGNTSTIYQKTGVENIIKTDVMEWLEENKATYIESGTVDGDELAVVLSNATTDKAGKVTITSVTLPEDAATGITFVDGKTLQTLNDAIATQVAVLNGNLTIDYYKDGYAYYPILIKHFGDDQTPWAADGSEGYSTEADFLGRYGALRNNWYDITVSGIKNIGTSSVPDVTEKFDDPENTYISVAINVLSWAKRTQTVDL